MYTLVFNLLLPLAVFWGNIVFLLAFNINIRAGHEFNRKQHSLALSLQILAVKPIVEASCVVTLRIAFSVVEVAPALQRGRAVLPRVIKVERAVAVVPAAFMVVAQHVAELVVLRLLTLRDVALNLHLCGRRDVVAQPSREVVIQDVASEAVEVCGADAVVERLLGHVFARASVIAGVGIAEAVSAILTLGPGECCRAHTLGTLAAGDAGASVATVEAATCLGIVLTGGASKALQDTNN